MRMRLLVLTFLAVIAMLGTRSSVEAHQPTQPQAMSKADATRAMRMIMTIQSNRPFGKGNYGLLEEVLKGVTLAGEDASRVDEHTATYRGYTIRMMRSAIRTHFALTMVPSGGLCGASYFANENQIIYSGQALGCPAQ
jgi:hypothetical protein